MHVMFDTRDEIILIINLYLSVKTVSVNVIWF